MKCQKCGQVNKDDAEACAKCGMQFPRMEELSWKWHLKTLAIIYASLVVFYLGISALIKT